MSFRPICRECRKPKDDVVLQEVGVVDNPEDVVLEDDPDPELPPSPSHESMWLCGECVPIPMEDRGGSSVRRSFPSPFGPASARRVVRRRTWQSLD